MYLNHDAALDMFVDCDDETDTATDCRFATAWHLCFPSGRRRVMRYERQVSARQATTDAADRYDELPSCASPRGLIKESRREYTYQVAV
jgi:hypothetical protein